MRGPILQSACEAFNDLKRIIDGEGTPLPDQVIALSSMLQVRATMAVAEEISLLREAMERRDTVSPQGQKTMRERMRSEP